MSEGEVAESIVGRQPKLFARGANALFHCLVNSENHFKTKDAEHFAYAWGWVDQLQATAVLAHLVLRVDEDADSGAGDVSELCQVDDDAVRSAFDGGVEGFFQFNKGMAIEVAAELEHQDVFDARFSNGKA